MSKHAIQVLLPSLFVKLARERYNQHTRGAPFRNHLLSESFFAPCVAHPTSTSAATQPYSLFWSLSPHCAHLAGLPAHLAPTFAQDPECWLPFLTVGPPRPLNPGAQVQLVFSGTSNTPIHRSWSPDCLLSCLPTLHLPSPNEAGCTTSFGFCFFLLGKEGRVGAALRMSFAASAVVWGVSAGPDGGTGRG